MADIAKDYLDLQGLQTYDALIKSYARSAVAGSPEYDAEHQTIILHAAASGGPSVSNQTLVFPS